MSSPRTAWIMSNPVSTFVRLSAIYDYFPSVLHEDVRASQLKSLEARVEGSVRGLHDYKEELYSSLSNTDCSDLIVLNGMAVSRGRSRYGYDLFSNLNNTSMIFLKTANDIVSQTRRLKPSAEIEAILGPLIVMSGSPLDFPARLVSADGLGEGQIKFAHTHPEIAQRYGFSIERGIDDLVDRPINSSYRDSAINFEAFKALSRARPFTNNLALAEFIDQGMSRPEAMERYEAFVAAHIRESRKIISGKNVLFLEQLSYDKVYIWSALSSTTYQLWTEAAQRSGVDFRVIGGSRGPLRNADFPLRAEADKSSQRLLAGTLRYIARSRGFTIPQKSEKVYFDALPYISVDSCPYLPSWIQCNIANSCDGPKSCLKTDLESLSEQDKMVLDKFTRVNMLGIEPIEAIIGKLNSTDVPLGIEPDLWQSWIMERGNAIIVPWDYRAMETTNYHIRASELGNLITPEMAATLTAKQIRELWDRKNEELAPYARRGRLVHSLMLTGEQSQHRSALPSAFELPRSSYAEKAIVYNYTPTSSHYSKLRNRFAPYPELVAYVDHLEESAPTIVVSGHPDVVVRFHEDDVPLREQRFGILDVKTGMIFRSEFKDQFSLYVLGLQQLNSMRSNIAYMGAVIAPFNPNRLLDEELRDETDYGFFVRMNTIPQRVAFNGNIIEEAKLNALQQYALKNYLGLPMMRPETA